MILFYANPSWPLVHMVQFDKACKSFPNVPHCCFLHNTMLFWKASDLRISNRIYCTVFLLYCFVCPKLDFCWTCAFTKNTAGVARSGRWCHSMYSVRVLPLPTEVPLYGITVYGHHISRKRTLRKGANHGISLNGRAQITESHLTEWARYVRKRVLRKRRNICYISEKQWVQG